MIDKKQDKKQLNHTLIVKLLRLRPDEYLSDEDIELPSSVEIEIIDNIPRHKLADAALDVFHDRVAVDCLEDFEFTVELDGEILATDDDHASYSLNGIGVIVGMNFNDDIEPGIGPGL